MTRRRRHTNNYGRRRIAYYLSPTTSIQGKYEHCFGIFETLGSLHNVYSFPCWAVDNGRFTGAWTEKKWRSMLEFYGERDGCLFSVVPDCPFDAAGTLEWFWRYERYVRNLGYPVALASQNGMTPEMVPWNAIDCLFVGGNDEHKRGPEGRALMIEAKQRDKHLHVGRVNSGEVIRTYFWMADSWDGRTLAIHPRQQYDSIGAGVLYARAMQERRQHSWSYYSWPSTWQPSLPLI